MNRIYSRVPVLVFLGLGAAVAMTTGCGSSASPLSSANTSVSASPVPKQATDTDQDGVPDDKDNCPNVSNADQADNNQNGKGDACDDAATGDTTANGSAAGGAADGNAGDNTQPPPSETPADKDADGIADAADNCPEVANIAQNDIDKDGSGDACDADMDGDAVANGDDNCPGIANADQKKTMNDQLAGDACNDVNQDADGDGISNGLDTCMLLYDPTNLDTDSDSVGNLCDNCLAVPNPKQTDLWNAGLAQMTATGDDIGDACQWIIRGFNGGDINLAVQPSAFNSSFSIYNEFNNNSLLDSIYVVGMEGWFGSHTSNQTSNDWLASRILQDGASLTDVWASSSQNIYVITNLGAVLHYIGEFLFNETVPCPQGYNCSLNRIWGSGPSDVYILGVATLGEVDNKPVLFHSSDGSSWTDLSSGLAEAGIPVATTMWGGGADAVYVAGIGDIILRCQTADTVTSCAKVETTGFEGFSWVIRLYGPSANDLYMILAKSDGNYELMHSTDGVVWTGFLTMDGNTEEAGYPIDIWASSETNIYFLMSTGNLGHCNVVLGGCTPTWTTPIPYAFTTAVRLESNSDGTDMTIVGSSQADVFTIQGVVLHYGYLND